MRVLMLSPQFHPLVGGYERAAERLSAALAARDHAVTVITERRSGSWLSQEERDGVQIHRLWCIYRPHLHLITSQMAFALFLVKQGRRFQVWHVHQYGLHTVLAVVLGKLLRRPVVLKLTNSGADGIQCNTTALPMAGFAKLLLCRVDAVVALSRETRAEAEVYGIPIPRIHILGNGVDEQVFRPRIDAERARLSKILGIDALGLVLFVGRLVAQKNPDGLLQAWIKARSSLPADWKLALIGDGPMRGVLESIVRGHGLEGSVLIVGQQTNIEQWMAVGDIYISSSHREGLSNTLLEAMASGLPVVATRVSGVSELVEESGAGLVAEVGDMDGMAHALVRLVGDAPLRERMGAVGRQVVEQRYTIEAVADRHEALYRSLITGDIQSCDQFIRNKPVKKANTIADLPRLLRVLMFVPQYPYPIVGGLEKQSHELAKALFAQDIEVQVVSGKIQPNQPNYETVEGVPVFRIPWSSRKLVRFLRAPLDVAGALWQRRRSFDVIHLHQHSWVGLYVILLAKLLGKPILTKLPNVGDFGLPGLRRQTFGWVRQAILLKSDAIVAMSNESLVELKHSGFSCDRVLLTPNGIALHPLPVLSPSDEVNAEVCKVVFVGRLSEEKQLDVLLDVWAMVCADRSHSATLAIWGEGPLVNSLKRQCADQCIATRVHFAGHVEDAASRLPELDIFVLPSRAEGNSNAILEAMAVGLPIVSTPVGGTPMLVGEEGGPFLCPPGDANALSSLLLRLIKDRSLRVATGMAMRRRAEQYFDIKRVAHTYAKAYGLLTAGQRDRVGKVSNPVVVEGR
ncbi:MAG: glycosyltransferase family 4 protein [Pseudomonadota bacterium]